MVKKSDEMKIAYDDWVAGGKIGAAPRPPIFVFCFLFFPISGGGGQGVEPGYTLL